MKKLLKISVVCLMLICVLTPTMTLVKGLIPEYDNSWSMDIPEMLAYIQQRWNSGANHFDWLYPKDGEKYQMFLQTSQSVELIRENNKDTSILGLGDVTLARDTLLDLINIWKMDFFVNTQSMFGVLSYLKMTTDSEVASMVNAFQGHLNVIYIDVDGRTFSSVEEIRNFVEIRSYSHTFQVNWVEASKEMKVKVGGDQVSWLTVGLSLWDCLNALFKHKTIAEEIAALPMPPSDATNQNIVDKIKQYEGVQVELGRLTTDFAEEIGKFIGSQIGKTIGLNIGVTMGASFIAAFPPAPVVGAAVGYFAGGMIGGELLGKAARTAAEILTNELVGKPLTQHVHELGIPTISARIKEVHSEGGDFDLATRERIYVTVEDTDPIGSPERELVVSVNPSDWQVTDYWGVLELERLDFDDVKTVKLSPGESETIWFAATPDGIHTDEELSFVLWHKTGMLWWTKQALVERHMQAFHSDFAFVPIDLILVLDRSGSMAGAKIDAAKNSAIAVVDSLMSVDRVGIASFSSSASLDAPLTSDFEYVEAQIRGISAEGSTSFGAGLSVALNEFEVSGSADHAWVMIFMSDGQHNTNPAPDIYVTECKNSGIPIYTIGLGDVDETLLKWMSSETGGTYLYAPSLYDLQNIFVRFSLEGAGWAPESELTGIVFEGQVVVAGTFDVAPFTAFVRITLNWPGSDLDLIILRPDGSKVDLIWDLDVLYSGTTTKPEWAILIAPQEGTWTVGVFGKVINSPDEPFVVWVSEYVPPVPQDTTPPTTTLTIGEPEYISDTTYVTPDTSFTLEATDAGSGVYSIAYRIYDATYDSSWIIYTAPFYLTSLTEGTYTIEYNSTDNVKNTETTHAINVTLFSWNYIYQDTHGRGTTLKISTAHKFFQFIRPNKDYGIKNATYMQICDRAIIIIHYDKELRLVTEAINTKRDLCITIAWDLQTRKHYFLVDKVGIERNILKHPHTLFL